MSNVAFLIIYITFFPTLATLAFLIGITTSIRGQRAHLRTFQRLRSLEDEFIVLVKTLENITILAEADRQTIQNLETMLQETRRHIKQQESQNVLSATDNMTFSQGLSRHPGYQRGGMNTSQATARSRRTGGTNRRSSRIPRPIVQLTNADLDEQAASTITTPPQTYTSFHEPTNPVVDILVDILPFVEPSLSTPQIESIVELFNDALQRSERENIGELSHRRFADRQQPRTPTALVHLPHSPSSTLVNPPSPPFNFGTIFDTPPSSSSSSLSGNTLLDSFSGTTLVSYSSSDSNDAGPLMRARRPRPYSRYSGHEELMMQCSNSILTPAQLAQVEAWEDELREANGWITLNESMDEEDDLGA